MSAPRQSPPEPVVTRQHDDFVIVKHDPTLTRRAAAFSLTGPGLDPDGIPFPSLADAVARGQEIARNSRVSVWDATGPEGLVLVGTFRR